MVRHYLKYQSLKGSGKRKWYLALLIERFRDENHDDDIIKKYYTKFDVAVEIPLCLLRFVKKGFQAVAIAVVSDKISIQAKRRGDMERNFKAFF